MEKFSLISPQQIINHLYNNSSSKTTHAFPKSKRFKTHNPECKEAFYANISSLSKKKVTIGRGKRSDFTIKTEPTPGVQYNMHSEFEKNKSAYTFSISRQKQPQNSYLYRFQKTKVPGPGAYQNDYKDKKPIMFTHRAKTVDVIKKHYSYLQNPGPGKYNQPQLMNKNGRFRISRYSDIKYSIINKAKRFSQPQINTPAPNAYKQPDQLNPQSKFILSHRRGKGTRPFDKELKFTIGYWKHNQNPGPGQYDKPSQFGVYGDSNYYKKLGQTH